MNVGAHGIAIDANTAAIYTLTNIPRGVCSDIASSLASISAAAYVYNPTTAVTEANADAITNLTVANQIKAPGGNVQGAAMGTQCNTAPLVSMSFVLRP
jgi:hypothetical protein